MSVRSLTLAEVRALARDLKLRGRKLPKMGYCQRLQDGREVCADYRQHDPDGRKPGKRYYFVGLKKR
jgi:hypothetical protein